MTTVVSLGKLRAILDEAAAGYWTDANLYKYLASGQSQAIQILLKIEEITRKTDGTFRHPDLAPLIKSANLTLVNGTATYTLPTGHLRTLSVELDYTDDALVWATEVSLAELGHLRANVYSIPTKTDPVFYIATIKTTGKALAFFPVMDYPYVFLEKNSFSYSFYNTAYQ